MRKTKREDSEGDGRSRSMSRSRSRSRSRSWKRYGRKRRWWRKGKDT